MNAPVEWDPRSPDMLTDPIGGYDGLRRRCPIAYSEAAGHTVLGHADALRVLMDPDAFSNQVSRYLSVPNGMDPPEHDLYRSVIEPYFDTREMERFTPICHAYCADLVSRLPADTELEFMGTVARPFAVSNQCAFLGWPESVHQPLLRWIDRKTAAGQSGDPEALAAVALQFDEGIRRLIATRRGHTEVAADDITARLMRERVAGRTLTEVEIVSILRNWTVGEVGTMAASAGIIAHYLAAHPVLQQQLRENPDMVGPANDEILRIHGPLLANRRRATRPVCLRGQDVRTDERVSIIWASANRDETVFGDPDEFRLDRDPALNLLYGAGIHVCPGAPLARMGLNSIVRELLAQYRIDLIPGTAPRPETYPSSGYREVPLRLTRH